MKTPVLVQAFHQANAGKLRLTDSVTITNSFKSIADGSPYSLSEKDDSELELYKQVGQKTTIYNLLYLMIIRSSNLATNMMIEMLGATQVTATAHAMGAKDIQVLRGVEDNKAFQQGLNNKVSAYGLMTIFEQIATGHAVNPEASKAMIDILLDQQFNDIIPALLPKDVKVAHKTGFITGIHHDSGIVFLPDGKKYVLVLLSKDLKDEKASVNMMAGVSKIIYEWMMAQAAHS
jgi:beta-lactamase class A